MVFKQSRNVNKIGERSEEERAHRLSHQKRKIEIRSE